MSDIVLEAGGGGPYKGSGVGNGVGDRGDWLNVGAGATQENERNLAISSLVPTNGVWLPGRHDVVQAWQSNGVAAGILAQVRLSGSSCEGREGSDNCSDELHFCELSLRELFNEVYRDDILVDGGGLN